MLKVWNRLLQIGHRAASSSHNPRQVRTMKSGSYWAYRETGAFDCDPDDCGPDFKVLSQSKHTARKPHSCDICDGLIAPGQWYEKVVLLNDGSFEIRKEHLDREECTAARKTAEEWHASQYDDINP